MPHWPEVIAAGLQSDDRHTGWLANAAAARYGIETFGLHWERLQADPLDGPWFDAWKSANSPARRDSLVDLARASFPRASIATGRAADTLGFGPEFRAHRALDWTLQALRDHPGLGADLVTLGLLSPMTRNRNMALAALKEWPVATGRKAFRPTYAESHRRTPTSAPGSWPTRCRPSRPRPEPQP